MQKLFDGNCCVTVPVFNLFCFVLFLFLFLIFRVRDLLHSGVITQSEKPIWYDVYAAFPPKREPLHVKPTAFAKTVQPVPEIFYPEDEVRA